MDNLEQRVFKIISDVMDVPFETVNLQSSPDNIDRWDSLMQMNLILALEEEFGLFFNDQQIIEMQNAELIIAILKEIIQSE